MMKFWKNLTKKDLNLIYIFLAILAIGIFLRTYNHHDWLRFNADQGRDAEVVSAVVDGASSWPILGPKAGGTEFKLGGAFYYFEIVAAKVFGNYPDKMAYPDLITGILCIPLLFFFLRKYFDKNVSLALVAIFAVSNYAIRYARFAWNPNSTPFWTILALYAMSEVLSDKNKHKYLWAIVCGIAIGVGVQLHTTLLLFLPITAIIVFGYLAIKNIKILKYFLVILAVSLFLNVPQLLGEYQTGGKNIQAFFGGIKTKQQAEHSIFGNVLHGSGCWVQGNLDIISGYEISDKCSFTIGNNAGDTLMFILAAIFVIGGTILAYKYARKEKDEDRKMFLLVVSIFTSVSFVIFIKLAYELSVRFYLILIFLPFLMLGFWIKFLQEKFKKEFLYVLLIPVIVLVASNLYFVQTYFAGLAAYGKDDGGDIAITILGETETFANFITANSNGAKQIEIGGDEKILFKAYKSIRYLAAKNNIDLLQLNKKPPLSKQYFYLGTLKDRDNLSKDANVRIVKFQDYGDFSILLVENIVN